jgi:outer membrane immunogenic protein
MRSILVVVALAASISAAAAADVLPPAPAAPPVYRPPPASPAYNWSGFYVGAMGGYGWSGSNSFSGGFAGGTIGGNAQFNNVVVGGELEGAWSNIGQTVTILGRGSATDRIRAFGSATARLGFAVDNLLIYGKGGFAAASNNINVSVLGVTVSDTQTHTGYTAGGGLEYGFAPNWSVKGEYLFAHYQSKNYFAGLIPPGVSSGAFDLHTVKVGLNYRFGWGGPVVARY